MFGGEAGPCVVQGEDHATPETQQHHDPHAGQPLAVPNRSVVLGRDVVSRPPERVSAHLPGLQRGILLGLLVIRFEVCFQPGFGCSGNDILGGKAHRSRVVRTTIGECIR
jgi:hypothetical protein